ncbi:DUF1904 family protein [Cobetia sp. cqz5-12]|nr:DUF1904 family protein [Cobetia sp. cqz5-12]
MIYWPRRAAVASSHADTPFFLVLKEPCMPQLRFHGVTPARLAPVSRTLVDQLSEATETARDEFTLECISTQYVFDGQVVDAFPFVEVLWFERGQSVRDICAGAIHQAMREAGYPEAETFFLALRPCDYYIAGKPLARDGEGDRVGGDGISGESGESKVR